MLFEKKKEKNCIEDLLLNMKYSIFIQFIRKFFHLSLPFYWWENWGLKKLSICPKFTYEIG